MLSSLGTLIMAHPIVAIGTLVAGAVTLAITNWERLKSWWESWNPAPKTGLEIEQNKAAVEATKAKYGTLDLRPSYMQAHASGGILTRPHIGLVAEDGPEAIIPLTNPSRGIPLLQQAADFLGAENFAPQIPPVNTLSSSSTSNYSPTINITVNGAGDDQQTLAEKIAQSVRDAMNDMMNFEERVSYA